MAPCRQQRAEAVELCCSGLLGTVVLGSSLQTFATTTYGEHVTVHQLEVAARALLVAACIDHNLLC
jgi:hypothetical protein